MPLKIDKCAAMMMLEAQNYMMFGILGDPQACVGNELMGVHLGSMPFPHKINKCAAMMMLEAPNYMMFGVLGDPQVCVG